MKTYTFSIKPDLIGTVDITARNENEAYEKALDIIQDSFSELEGTHGGIYFTDRGDEQIEIEAESY